MTLFRRIAAWWRTRRRADDLADEIEAHRAIVQDALERAGFTAADAAAESRRRMGNVAIAREDSREVWIARWLDRLSLNLRYAVRGLRREPLFALSAVITLGLGMAAATTVFGVVDAEIWRPLPYPDPHRLVAVRSTHVDGRSNDTDGISLAEFQEWRQAATAFASLAAEGSVDRRTIQIGRAESIVIEEVTANYLTTLGRPALSGRVFTDADADGAHVAVLTARGWQRVFDRDPAVVGRTFVLDGRAITIVGLIARDDSMGLDTEMFLPIDERTSTAPLFSMVGRLAPGASMTVARQQAQAVVDARGATEAGRRGHVVATDDLSEFFRRTDRRPLYFFLGAAALVLVLTVTNIAGLLVARAIRRTPEFALRGALGGMTGALAAQTVVESALVAVPGCAIAWWLAHLVVSTAAQWVPDDLLWRGTNITLGLPTAMFTVVMAVVTTAVITLGQLGIVRRAGSRAALESGHRAGEAPRSARVRRVLLVGQLAVTVVLLSGAGVFLESFLAVMTAPIGFDPANAWSLRLTLSGPSYATPEAIAAYVDSAVARLHAVPGVRDVAPATSSPLYSGWLARVATSGNRSAGASASAEAVTRLIGPEYFEATGTPILRGRAITRDDRAGTPFAAVVNEEFVRRELPGVDPIGQKVEFAGVHAAPVGQGAATIVGVVANIKEVGLKEGLMPDLYLSFAQRPFSSIEIVVRADRADPGMPAALRAAMADPLVPVTTVTALGTRVDRALRPDRFNVAVVGGFAAMALLMSAIGIYGAMAYAASSRRREFGVRMALGAAPRTLVGAMLWQSARLSLAGAALGLAGALVITRAVGDALYFVPGRHNGMLYHVSTSDPLALGGALVSVVALALLAAALPARRVARIDPVRALRAD